VTLCKPLLLQPLLQQQLLQQQLLQQQLLQRRLPLFPVLSPLGLLRHLCVLEAPALAACLLQGQVLTTPPSPQGGRNVRNLYLLRPLSFQVGIRGKTLAASLLKQ